MHMYHYRPARQSKRKGGYLFPFLAIILIGLSVILAFQIFAYFRDKQVKQFEDKVAVNLMSGKAEIKIWGVDQWTSAIDGTVVTEGDALRTAPGSRAELTFLNGSIIRMDADTHIEFIEVQSREATDAANINVVRGSIWVKGTQDNTVRAHINASTKHLQASGLNVIYGITAGETQAVHVLDGIMQVSVLDETERTKSLETLEVEFGQEVELTNAKQLSVQQRRPVQLVALLDDNYRDSEWYRWNRARDIDGGDALTVEEAVQKEDEPVAETPVTSQAEQQQVADILNAPVITQPNTASITTEDGQVTIAGTTDTATQTLEITPGQGINQEPYVLSKYRPGSTQWSYMASIQYGNLINGENTFSIIAIDADGRRSEPAEIRFTHTSTLPPADLAAPKITRITKESPESYLVEGTVGKGITRVTVNGFPLSLFRANNTTWSYRAATKYSNLKLGENRYEVYGQDASGNKTEVGSFTIQHTADAPQDEAPNVSANP